MKCFLVFTIADGIASDNPWRMIPGVGLVEATVSAIEG